MMLTQLNSTVADSQVDLHWRHRCELTIRLSIKNSYRVLKMYAVDHTHTDAIYCSL